MLRPTLRRLLFGVTSAALALGIAKAWAQRKQSEIAAQDKGLPTNFDEMTRAEQRRAEKKRRKDLRKGS